MESNLLHAPSASLIWSIIGLGVFLYLVKLLKVERYANEPAYVEPTIPVVGHAIGLLWRRYSYYVELLLVEGTPQL